MNSRDDCRLIVVTGATRGLGRAMTARFIEAGHTVAGCGRSASHVAELRERPGDPHRFDVVDVTDAEAVAAWAVSVIESHGTPDLLVNNAALINRNAPLWEVPAEEFSDVIDVNLKGVANVIRGFVPAMVARASGVIVNFSSTWGRSSATSSGKASPNASSKARKALRAGFSRTRASSRRARARGAKVVSGWSRRYR